MLWIFLPLDGHPKISRPRCTGQAVIPDVVKLLAGQRAFRNLDGEKLAGKEVHDPVNVFGLQVE